MVKRKNEEFDRTDLDIPKALERGMIHRDYVAHCFRWSYVKKFLSAGDKTWGYPVDNTGHYYRKNNAHILDVGCGEDLMLYKTLNSTRMIPQSYTGVDINKLITPKGFEGSRLKPTLLGETDFCSIEHLDTQPNIVVSFEVLEHVPNEYAREMIKHMYKLSSDNAYMIISTPVLSEKYGMAKNHINEMTRAELKTFIENAGWNIEENFGTFAGQYDMFKFMTKEDQELYNRISKYYDSAVMSTIFAPLYPEHSRNNIWVCSKKGQTNGQTSFKFAE